MESWCVRAGRLGAGLTLVLLTACGPSTTGPGATASSSSSSSSSSSGASGNTSSGGSSSSTGGPCREVACALACPFGFAPGPDGCLTCSCLPDPRPCGALDPQECAANANCAAVSFQNSGGTTGTQCCTRLPDGSIRCADEPPPPVCMQDSECRPGQVCNIVDFCELPPGCDPTQGCPAVCYGRCVSTTGGCVSDWDCREDQVCAYGGEPAPCPDDPNSGACPQRYQGTCEPVACPAIAVLCPNGQPPTQYVNVPHGCPIPVCDGVACETLPPDQCELRRDCQALYAGDCACRCDATSGECPPCTCPPPSFTCVSRPSCFSDQQCGPGEYCDFTFDDCVDCGRPPMGLCIQGNTRCESLGEADCGATAGCTPVYGEVCPGCPDGSMTCPPCSRSFLGCRADNTVFCSRDLDCGPGMRCNLCPSDPTCPQCDVCGPPVCEPAPPPDRCSSDAQCGPGLVCAFDVCTDSIPPFCVGSCVPAAADCTGLDERACSAAPACEPVYDRGCMDGCHDDQGRRTSCGPCLAIACPVANFVGCEPARFHGCCSDLECSTGQTCQFTRDINVGECVTNTNACGPDQSGACPPGSVCEIIGCLGSTEPPSSGGSSGGSTGCAAHFACVPVTGCTTDLECGPGMQCNTCPPDPTCPDCTVCGPARCESIPAGQCRTDADCIPGCGCRPGPTGEMGTCSGPADEACPGRTFRVCSDDTQCLPDEMCQRCPPGAACFVADHCVPRERPFRTCSVDSECLPDEHCGDTCVPGATCDQVPHCVPGAPSLRTCSSNLECRPDEYCQQCPPGALCILPDHCEPRTFRTCEMDAQCLPDETCVLCPPNAVCPYAGRCELRSFRTCDADTDCLSGERCEMCPPNALCFVADHCVPR